MRRVRTFGQAGFSPIEALLATAAGLLAISAFATFNSAQMYTMRDQGIQVDLQSSARTVVDLFGREARRAGTGINPNCTGTSSTSITWASAWTVRFKADLNGNGNTSSSSETNEDVTWWISTDNNAIWRTDNNRTSSPDTLWSGSNVNGVSALNGSQFLFYDSNGNAITAASGGSGLLSATQLTQVVRIVMQLSVATTGTAPGGSRTLTASDSAVVDLRNRYFVMASSCGPATQTSPLTFYR